MPFDLASNIRHSLTELVHHTATAQYRSSIAAPGNNSVPPKNS
jgi:hypothetical protein